MYTWYKYDRVKMTMSQVDLYLLHCDMDTYHIDNLLIELKEFLGVVAEALHVEVDMLYWIKKKFKNLKIF